MKNVGIIGLGNIANRVAKGVLCSKNACLYAVASRSVDNAKSFANKYGALNYYGSYEEMLNDPKVDLVYICTPNTLHYEQIKLCFAYGKHVICEKPM
ncbi:MAG: Gfo/Idh/MocA family oxidoreductase, partial [Lachnospiraceae bacterium]|nr:Gfo/Idh/MocA family oxidoreductase [Lachnospiraceae bacterium]